MSGGSKRLQDGSLRRTLNVASLNANLRPYCASRNTTTGKQIASTIPANINCHDRMFRRDLC
jgi:hypothetical protein